MTAWRQAIELSIGDEDVARLVTITRSRTEPASRVERARMLLAYRENPSFGVGLQPLCLIKKRQKIKFRRVPVSEYHPAGRVHEGQ